MIKRILITLSLSLLLPMALKGDESSIGSLSAFHEAAAMNSGKIQQEMIYLHLDNTSYYRGDRLYFAGYLVTASRLTPSTLSRTVYVELLNPGGKIIDRCVLRPHLGRFHGSLLVDETPFYSGYYEIRAYTKYMLNFGEESIYSRTVPVFREPKTEGDWADRSMLEYGSKTLAFERPKPEKKTAKLSARFFPEGGHLVDGLESTVAFEIYDDFHRPIRAYGVISDTKGREVASFQSGVMGRGSFAFIPDGNEKYRAEIVADGKNYLLDLPQVEKEGVVLHVSSSTNEADSVEITIARTPGFSSDMYGVSFSCRGRLCFRAIADLSSTQRVGFKVPRSEFPTGVIQATLFDPNGNVLADRLFFNNKHDFLEARYTLNKEIYDPFEPIEFEVNLTSALSGVPRNIPFAISVTDDENEIDHGSNMLADLLLASEIKGYIYRPSYYFEQPDDSVRRRELDELLMVQGWRRYSWECLTGLKEHPITVMPERGIEVNGLMLSSRTNKPQPGVGISALFYDMGDATTLGARDMLYDSNMTDSLGRFAINAELSGNWMMTLTANNKKGDLAAHRILLDHSERPDPRAYDPGELHCEQRFAPIISHTDTIVDTADDIFRPKSGTLLKEIEVIGEANRYAAAQYIDNSTVCYDISAARNILQDSGKKYIRHLSDLLPLIDENFFVTATQLTYKGKEPIFILDKEMGTNSATAKYNNLQPALAADIPLYMIKNVYVNNTNEAIIDYGVPVAADDAFIESCKFIDPSARRNYVNEILTYSSAIKQMADSARTYGGMLTEEYASKRFGCVVFLELISSHREKIQPGMRRTVIEGYTSPVEFYSPDYSDSPPLPDEHRRTLYWNPNAIPGRKLRFYNNNTPSRLNVTITALDPTGHILR